MKKIVYASLFAATLIIPGAFGACNSNMDVEEKKAEATSRESLLPYIKDRSLAVSDDEFQRICNQLPAGDYENLRRTLEYIWKVCTNRLPYPCGRISLPELHRFIVNFVIEDLKLSAQERIQLFEIANALGDKYVCSALARSPDVLEYLINTPGMITRLGNYASDQAQAVVSRIKNRDLSIPRLSLLWGWREYGVERTFPYITSLRLSNIGDKELQLINHCPNLSRIVISGQATDSDLINLQKTTLFEKSLQEFVICDPKYIDDGALIAFLKQSHTLESLIVGYRYPLVIRCSIPKSICPSLKVFGFEGEYGIIECDTFGSLSVNVLSDYCREVSRIEGLMCRSYGLMGAIGTTIINFLTDL